MSVKFCLNIKKKNRAVKETLNPSDKNGLFLKGGGDKTLILVHGFTGSPQEMLFLAKFFNKSGYSVVCPRLANHGEPIDVLKNTKWQDCYRSVREAFIEAENLGYPKQIFVAGLSVGALLGILLADEFHGKIRGASLLAPTLFYDGWNVPWVTCFLPIVYPTPLKNFFYFKEEPPYGIKNEALRRRVHEYYNNANLEDAGNVAQYGYPYYPVALLYQHNLLVKYFCKRLPHIDVPVQLIQAKDDDMTSIKNSQFIYDKIASKVKEINFLADSYHVITVDQERDVVAEKMFRFFNNLEDSNCTNYAPKEKIQDVL